MANKSPKMTKEFFENQIKRMGDLSEKDVIGKKVFGIRLPLDVQEKMTLPNGRNNTALMRKIVVEVVRNQPELLAQCEEELNS